MTKEHRKNGFIDQGKYKKRFMERKCIDIQYHAQDDSDVAHKDVIMYCTKSIPGITILWSIFQTPWCKGVE